MTYGELFKQIRIEKGLSLADLADADISPSFIGKFERNQSRISADRFIRLLQKMQVSLDEFIYRVDDHKSGLRFMTYIDVLNHDGTMSLPKIRIAKQRAHEKWVADAGDLAARFAEGLLAISEYELTPRNIDDWQHFLDYFDKMVGPVVDYLANVSFWGEFEIRVFTYYSAFLSLETRLSLGNRVLRSLAFYQDFYEVDHQVNILLTMISSTVYESLPATEQLLKQLDERLKVFPNMDKRVLAEYERGRYLYGVGERKQGEQLVKQMVQVMRRFGETQDANLSEFFFEQYKKSLIPTGTGTDRPHSSRMFF